MVLDCQREQECQNNILSCVRSHCDENFCIIMQNNRAGYKGSCGPHLTSPETDHHYLKEPIIIIITMIILIMILLPP